MRSIWLYLFLVIFPLLALIGVIQVGERIVPPTFIGGVWRLTETSPNPDEGACTPVRTDSDSVSRTLDIEVNQSGRVLEVRFLGRPPARAQARLRGDTLVSEPLRGGTPCAPDWMLAARLEGPPGAERMTGRWLPVGCETCPDRPFTATRLREPSARAR